MHLLKIKIICKIELQFLCNQVENVFIYFLFNVMFLGVPHLSSETEISIVRRTAMEARIMMFVVPGEHPNLTRTAETLATITGGRITVLDTRPYVPDNKTGVTDNAISMEGKRLIKINKIF